MSRSTIAISIAFLSAVCLRADNMAYVANSIGGFGTIDLATGAISVTGNSGQTLAGLAVANGSLFGATYHAVDSTLYTVNPSNGALTSVGSTTINVDDFGSTTSGLYAVDTAGNLYSISSTTGAATLIGPIGLTLGSWRCLSTNSATLYFADGANLYTLSTTTGAASLVGAFTGSAEEGALLYEGGTLYGGDNVENTIDRINTTTGAATVGPTASPSMTFYGLAPLASSAPGSTVPEPATSALLGGGSIGLLLFRRFRRSLAR